MAEPIPLSPNMSQPQMAQAINENAFTQANEDITKVYKDKQGIPNIIIGRLPDDSTGIKIAKPGEDVTSAGDDKLNFNSAQNVFKILMTGTATMDSDDLVDHHMASTQVDHNFGFAPVPLVYITFDAGGSYQQLPASTGLTTGGDGYSVSFNNWIFASTTTDSLYIQYYCAPADFGAGILQFKYYLLQESVEVS